MNTMQASEFEAKCLALVDQVARTGRTIVITKHGKPVAELRPHRPPRAKSLIGLLDGALAVRALELSGLHDDPADRFIVASALVHGAALMTADERLLDRHHPIERHYARK